MPAHLMLIIAIFAPRRAIFAGMYYHHGDNLLFALGGENGPEQDYAAMVFIDDEIFRF
ncbi:hypothetical protein KCP71_16690 [Salmonella enterica subsp. enterica]|nr:hypothetical protein KCP71_16690 [Salmonella enterica subsp. enterica]